MMTDDSNRMERDGAVREDRAGSGEVAGAPSVRVAALDIGSNAIRYLAAAVGDSDRLTILESRRYAVRLGHDAFAFGRLTDASIAATIEALSHTARSMEALGVERYRAVATSAVRESRNADELVTRLRDATGLELETISGREEAWLVWNALRRRVMLDSGRWLLVDMGGGSVEVTLVEGFEILSLESYPAGAVRLLEEFAADRADAPDLVPRLEEAVANRLPLAGTVAHGVRGVVITGGSAEALGDLVRVRRGSPRPVTAAGGVAGTTLPEPDRISLDELRTALADLEALPIAARIEKFNLRRDRADVIVPAAVVFGWIARVANTAELLIPRVGVKEGIVFELADQLRARATISPALRSVQ